MATKKKASPSTLRRNAKRREEFLKRKHQPAQQQEKSETVKEKPRQRAAFQCDQCDNHFKSESGLKIHIGKSHKAQQAAEILRGDLEEEALTISQQSEVTREEVGQEKGEPVSPPTTRPKVITWCLHRCCAINKKYTLCPSWPGPCRDCPSSTEY